jgi:hypothetical protein
LTPRFEGYLDQSDETDDNSPVVVKRHERRADLSMKLPTVRPCSRQPQAGMRHGDVTKIGHSYVAICEALRCLSWGFVFVGTV